MRSAAGDVAPYGAPPVKVDSETTPGAVIKDGVLRVVESGAAGNRLLATTQSFDLDSRRGAAVGFRCRSTWWIGGSTAAGQPAERVGYYLALTDYEDKQAGRGGNLLIDGNPVGGAEVHRDYPGQDSRPAGKIGGTGYEAGHRYGVRITKAGADRYQLEHVVDWVTEDRRSS